MGLETLNSFKALAQRMSKVCWLSGNSPTGRGSEDGTNYGLEPGSTASDSVLNGSGDLTGQ